MKELISKEEEKLLAVLHPLKKTEDCKKEYLKARRKYVIGGAVGGILLMICLIFADGEALESGSQVEVERNAAGEKSREENYVAEADGEKYPLEITVESEQLLQEEAEEIIMQAKEEIHEKLLREGDTFSEIRHNLNLISSAQDGMVRVSYTFDDYHVIHSDGVLAEDEISEKGSPIVIRVLYEVSPYTESEEIEAVLFPPIRTKAEEFLYQIQNAVAQRQEDMKYESSFLLPDTVNGQKIRWSRPKDYRPYIAGAFGLIIGVLLAFRQKQQLKEEKKKRIMQLNLDYPKMISRMALFLKCGSSLLTTWEIMINGYEQRQSERHYVYEEMIVTYREIKAGVPISAAFENFGRRCDTSRYVRLGMLLSQNLKQGAKGLLAQLELEAEEAYVHRVAAARKKGEEAMTKILFPLMLLLVIAMAVIMVPAFVSF